MNQSCKVGRREDHKSKVNMRHIIKRYDRYKNFDAFENLVRKKTNNQIAIIQEKQN